MLSFRTRSIVISGIALASLLFFWPEFCVWRASSNLQQRHDARASIWMQRSRWLWRRTSSRDWLLQIRILRHCGQFREMEDWLKRGQSLGVSMAELQREQWLAMAQAGQFASMQNHWKELLGDARDDAPEIARAYYSWAMRRHRLDLAKRTLDLWQQDFPSDPEPVYLTGRFYHSIYDLKRAEEAYRRAVSLAPGNDDYRLALATLLLAQLNPREAIPLFKAYLKKHSQDLAAIQGLAESLAMNGELENAIPILQEALKQNPDEFTLQKTCGELLLASGDARGAVELLEKAHRTVPEHANLANELARALKACGRSEESEPLFAFVKEALPQLRKMSTYEKTLQQQPNDLELRMKIARITAKYSSRKDACVWYENLLQIAPDYLPARQALSGLYHELGDESQAAKHSKFIPDDFQTKSTGAAEESR